MTNRNDAMRQAAAAAHRALETTFFHGRDDRRAALDKLREEADEIAAAQTDQELESEIGDALFVLVRLAVQEDIDAEEALGKAASRFRSRIDAAAGLLYEDGLSEGKATLAEWEAAWTKVKRRG